MCGIVGGIALKGAADGSQWASRMEAALDKLALRGPDGHGIYRHGPAVLAQSRLAILDLSSLGNQPMYSADGRYTLVFNGEIFNYRELRRDRLPADLPIRSTGDTEVLLNLLIRYGADCLDWLNGFFAIAFYDRETGVTLIARDRYGIKPLLLYQNDDSLLFASEMKSLLELGVPRQLDMASVALYFELNYLPPDRAIFQGMRKLLPGRFLRVKGAEVTEHVYYTLPDGPAPGQPAPDYATAQQHVRDLLDAAVQRRLISDVPVGLFLSGGIDSSVVAALASRHATDLRSFSISFTNELYDERPYAEAVARKFGLRHTVLQLSYDDLYASLDDALNYLCEPFADSSAINFYVLSKFTRPHITVALTGDAADELFGGYSKHQAEARVRQPGGLNSLLKLGGSLLDLLPLSDSRNSKLGRKVFQLKKYTDGLRLSPEQRYWRWLQNGGEEQQGLLRQQPAEAVLEQLRQPWKAPAKAATDMNGVLKADMGIVLTGDMLVKADLMSMANSLEVRTPFLDYDLVDYVSRLPADYKTTPHMRKRILQDAFREILPAELYNRPKQGFEVPLTDWFRTALRTSIERDLLNRDFVESQGLFNYSHIQQLWNRVKAGGSGKSDAALWAIIVFQHWYRRYAA